MRTQLSDRFLVFGLTLLIVGLVLLSTTLGLLPLVAPLWPLLVVAGGVAALRAGLTGRWPEAAVFAGLFLVLGGVFFLLLTTVMSAVELSRVWPAFMTIAGVSVVAYARFKPAAGRLTLTIPGYVIIVLSIIFLLFSFDVVDEDFTAFVARWWPVIFVAAGIGLLAAHFGMKNRTRTRR